MSENLYEMGLYGLAVMGQVSERISYISCFVGYLWRCFLGVCVVFYCQFDVFGGDFIFAWGAYLFLLF